MFVLKQYSDELWHFDLTEDLNSLFACIKVTAQGIRTYEVELLILMYTLALTRVNVRF